MTQETAYALAGALLFCLGLFGVFLVPHLLKRIMALNVTAIGVFLVLVAVAKRNAAPEPDPVPHAMLLTGIVVAISASAFAIRLARSYFDASGEVDLDFDEDEPGAGKGTGRAAKSFGLFWFLSAGRCFAFCYPGAGQMPAGC